MLKLSLCFLSIIIFFQKDVCLEWWNRCFCDLEIKIFFFNQPWWEDLYIYFFKFSVDFTIQWWYLCEFLENIKKFTFLHYQVFSKSPRGNRKLQKVECTINALNFHQFWIIRSTCITKVGCTFWTCQMLPLNSKKGPGIVFM